MIEREYAGKADLTLLQDFNSRAIALTDHCGYLHPGDIPHHIYSGNRFYDPSDLLTIWEDADGIAAWLLVNVTYKSFDLQVRPDLRGSDFERALLKTAYNRTAELMRRHEIESDCVYADAFRGDTARSQLLSELGWQREDELPYVLNRMVIPPVRMPELPEGFTYGHANGPEDAASLGAVHNASFGSSWTPDMYRKVMESPGYDPKRELVIRAPDGSFIAFCVIRFDRLNRMGLFEPVGTDKAYHRQGFGRAVMLYGLQQMISEGMTAASVAHFGSNQAAKGLYQSLGFRPWHLVDEYMKKIGLEE